MPSDGGMRFPDEMAAEVTGDMSADDIRSLPDEQQVRYVCAKAKGMSGHVLDRAWPAFVRCARGGMVIPDDMAKNLPGDMKRAYDRLANRRADRVPMATDRHGDPCRMPLVRPSWVDSYDVTDVSVKRLGMLPPDILASVLGTQCFSSDAVRNSMARNRDSLYTNLQRCMSAGWEVPDSYGNGLTERQRASLGMGISEAARRTLERRKAAEKAANDAYAAAVERAVSMDMPSEEELKAFTKKQRKNIRLRYRKAVEKDQERRVMEVLPQGAYKDEFPEARSRVRKFVLHVGPTNSGKTHDAIEALEAAESGTYLAPLRLLALEVGETVREAGVPCDIVTGEEADYDEDEGTRHVSSTVEMLDTERPYDVAVIDEAQMLDDRERGWSWTRAIVGVNADVVHVCMAQRAEGIVTRIIEMCGDEISEVVRHERKTPLTVEPEPFDWNPRPGDALVCFSRKAVLATATDLEKAGIKASVVYGALPWQARKREAEKFREGTTQVVVATDSIGMGLNLPIRRVVFLEDRKFDGVKVRELLTEEWKQIAGRAGRLGMYDEGFCTTTTRKGNKALRQALEGASPQIKVGYIGFPRDVASDVPLSRVMKVWSETATPAEERGVLVKQPLDNAYAAAVWVDGQSQQGAFDRKPTRDEEMRMVTVPFDMDRDEQATQWFGLVRSYLRGDDPLEGTPGHTWWANMPRGRELADSKLEWLESILRQLGISYGFLRQMRRLTRDDEREYAEYRNEVYAEVVRKLDGPKSLLGSYYVTYKDADQEAEYQRRRREREEYYYGGDGGWWY